jgi:hypothetical protein
MKKILPGTAGFGSTVSHSLVTGEEGSHLPFVGSLPSIPAAWSESRIATAEDISTAFVFANLLASRPEPANAAAPAGRNFGRSLGYSKLSVAWNKDTESISDVEKNVAIVAAAVNVVGIGRPSSAAGAVGQAVTAELIAVVVGDR